MAPENVSRSSSGCADVFTAIAPENVLDFVGAATSCRCAPPRTSSRLAAGHAADVTGLLNTSMSSTASRGTWISKSVSTTLLLRSPAPWTFLLASMVTVEPSDWMSSLIWSRRSRVARRTASTVTFWTSAPVIGRIRRNCGASASRSVPWAPRGAPSPSRSRSRPQQQSRRAAGRRARRLSGSGGHASSSFSFRIGIDGRRMRKVARVRSAECRVQNAECRPGTAGSRRQRGPDPAPDYAVDPARSGRSGHSGSLPV